MQYLGKTKVGKAHAKPDTIYPLEGYQGNSLT